MGRKVFIEIRPVRYQCPDCDGNPKTTQKLSWYERKSPHTRAYEKHILLSCVNSTVSDVSIKEDIGYEAVIGIINRYINKKVDWNTIEILKVIGLDEISLKKGHKDFVTIVTGRNGNETVILGVLEDRAKATVKSFLLSIPKRLRRNVGTVCSDMYDGFINAAKEVFGKKTHLVIDRFHVAKLYRKGFETLRKKELKRIKKELSDKEYKKLKGVMWILRKKEKDLSDEDKKVLALLFKHSVALKKAYLLRNELSDIFDMEITRQHAKLKINAWMRRVKISGLDCFDGFLATLKKHNNEIANYFIDRHTSGFVEGLNNKIKVIKRRCYGVLNPQHLFQRIFLDLSGYSLNA